MFDNIESHLTTQILQDQYFIPINLPITYKPISSLTKKLILPCLYISNSRKSIKTRKLCQIQIKLKLYFINRQNDCNINSFNHFEINK